MSIFSQTKFSLLLNFAGESKIEREIKKKGCLCTVGGQIVKKKILRIIEKC